MIAWILTNWCPTYAGFLFVHWECPLNVKRYHAHLHMLDSPCHLRTVDHTAVLLSMHTEDILWEEYCITLDAKVCISPCLHNTKADSSQPYTSYFPRADIHELITSDLLHQVIKGVFKDYLVSWVSEYLDYFHRTAGKEQVLDEIDCRSVEYL